MRPPIEILANYLNLARAAQQRQQPLVRDRALLLAAVIAAQIELRPIAAACREQILTHNKRHIVGRWPNLDAALSEEDFQTLVNRLATRYGPERVEQMVERLDLQPSIEREDFVTDGEYAASLLGLTWNELLQRFGDEFDD